MCHYLLNSVLWFPKENDVRYRQLFVGWSCLTYLIWICLCIVMSNTHWVAFLLCFSSSFVSYVSLDCPLFIVPSVFSNVYLERSQICGSVKPVNEITCHWKFYYTKLYKTFYQRTFLGTSANQKIYYLISFPLGNQQHCWNSWCFKTLSVLIR